MKFTIPHSPSKHELSADGPGWPGPSEDPTPGVPVVKDPQVVLITGCSSGFGLITAVHLAKRGHFVVATMRDLARQNNLVNELRIRDVQKRIDILRLDVTDKQSIDEVKKKIALKFGYLDVLINNAGYAVSGFFEVLSDDDIRQLMETNFFGVQNVTRAMISLMRPRRKGRIINVSSTSGQSSCPCFSAYNASKWALEGWSEALMYELKLFGIDVLLVEPGAYPTNIFYNNARYAKNFDDPDSPYFEISQGLKKNVLDHIDRNKKDPLDVARLIERLMYEKHPPFRSVPDRESCFFLAIRKILPFSVFSSLLYRGTFHGIKNKI